MKKAKEKKYYVLIKNFKTYMKFVGKKNLLQRTN